MYQDVYARLEKRARSTLKGTDKAVDDDKVIDPVLVVNYFLENRVTWRPATERLYKAAILHNFEPHRQIHVDHWSAHQKLMKNVDPSKKGAYIFDGNLSAQKEMVDKLAEISFQRKINEQERQRKKELANTSGQKAKHVLTDDIAKLIEAFDRSSSKWKNDTKVWFQAACLTGTRPIEWANSSLESNSKGVLVLCLMNAKTTNNRSFGETRTLIMDKLSPENIAVVRKQVENARAMQARGHYQSWFEACRNLIKIITRQIWPNRLRYPTLYSARHIFAANAKNTLSRKEVAALMGHGSELTASHHYARRSSASGKLDVTPSEEDMNALTKRNGVTSQEPRTSDWLLARQGEKIPKGNDVDFST